MKGKNLYLGVVFILFFAAVLLTFTIVQTDATERGTYTDENSGLKWEYEVGRDGVSIIGCDSISKETKIESISVPSRITVEGKEYDVVRIGDYIFNKDSTTSVSNINKSTVKKITIPNTVVSIGNGAFSGFASVNEIEFGEKSSLKTIGKGAFELNGSKTYNNDTLERIELNGNLNINSTNNQIVTIDNAEVGSKVIFEGSYQLVTANIELKDSYDFTYEYKKGISITQSLNKDDINGENFKVMINGEDVKIKEFKFLNNSINNSKERCIISFSVDEKNNGCQIEICLSKEIDKDEAENSRPDSVKKDNWKRWVNKAKPVSSTLCKLELIEYREPLKLILPDSVETIGDSAFDYAYRITVSSDSSLVRLDSHALKNVTGSVYLPRGLSHIAGNAINHSAIITLSSENPYYNIDGNYNLTDESGKKLVAYHGNVKNYVFSDSIKEVGDYAFEGNQNIKNVEYNNDLKWGRFPFVGSSLNSITFPEGIESIPDYMLCDTRIVNLEIPSSVITIGEKAFFNNSKLESVKVLSGDSGSRLSTIGLYAFCYNPVLRTFEAGNHAEGYMCSIKEGAFYSCDSLQKIVIDDEFNIIEIDTGAFAKSVSNSAAVSFGEDNKIVIPKEVQTIGDGAFSISTNNVHANTDLTSAGACVISSSFTGKLNADSWVVEFESGSELSSIGFKSFSGLNGLKKIDLSNCMNLVSIGSSAFADSFSMGDTELLIPTNSTKLEEISANAFNWSKNIIESQLQLPGSIKSIGTKAFNGSASKLTFQSGSLLENIDSEVLPLNGRCEIDLSNCLHLKYVGINDMILPKGVYEMDVGSDYRSHIKNWENVVVSNYSDVIRGETEKLKNGTHVLLENGLESYSCLVIVEDVDVISDTVVTITDNDGKVIENNNIKILSGYSNASRIINIENCTSFEDGSTVIVEMKGNDGTVVAKIIVMMEKKEQVGDLQPDSGYNKKYCNTFDKEPDKYDICVTDWSTNPRQDLVDHVVPIIEKENKYGKISYHLFLRIDTSDFEEGYSVIVTPYIGSTEQKNIVLEFDDVKTSIIDLNKDNVTKYDYGGQIDSYSYLVKTDGMKPEAVNISGVDPEMFVCKIGEGEDAAVMITAVDPYLLKTGDKATFKIQGKTEDGNVVERELDIIFSESHRSLFIGKDTLAINSRILSGIDDIFVQAGGLFDFENGCLIYDGRIIGIDGYTKVVTIDEGSDVIGIRDNAFENSAIESLEILSDNVEVGDYILKGTRYMSSIYLLSVDGVAFSKNSFSESDKQLYFYIPSTADNTKITMLQKVGKVSFGYNDGSGSMIYLPAMVDGKTVSYTDMKIEDGKFSIRPRAEGGYTMYDMGATVGDTEIKGNGPVLELEISGKNIIVKLFFKERTTADSVDVVFSGNGGKSGQSETVTVRIPKSATVLDAEIPIFTKDRSDFVCWEDSYGNKYDFDSPVIGDIILKARWAQRDPVVKIEVEAGVVLLEDNPVDSINVEKGKKYELTLIPYDGYEIGQWRFLGEDRGSAKMPLVIEDLETDIVLTVSSTYFSPSSGLVPISNRGLPTLEGIDRAVKSWTAGGDVDTSGMKWTGHSSVPLIVGDYTYIRVKDALYKIESDTGYVVNSVKSVSTSDFYHQIGYGNGAIVDCMTNCVYDLDLNFEFKYQTSNNSKITGVEYYDGYFYSSGTTLMRFPAESESKIVETEIVGTFDKSVYSSYGFSMSVFEDGYVYRVYTEGNDRGIAAMNLSNGSTSHVRLDGISGMYLDDGWISEYDGVLYLPGYTTGLFGAIATAGSDVLSYVKFEKGTFGNQGSVKFDNGITGFTSQFVVSDGIGYIVAGGLHAFRMNADGTPGEKLAEAPMAFSHGSISIDSSYATKENGYLTYIYMIPYQTSSSTMAVAECQWVDGNFIMKSYASSNFEYNYNSQAIRAGSEGQMIWYNDSGWIFSYTLPEKNRFFFFIEDQGSAQWYESYGATSAEALEGLGSDVVTLTQSYAIRTIYGDDATGWSLFFLKKDISGYQKPDDDANGWKKISDLFDRTRDLYHYYMITSSNSVPVADTYTYINGSGTGEYKFVENVGDRSVVGKPMYAGKDVFTIRFYNDGVEIDGSALIGGNGKDVKGSFPMISRAGYSGYWTIVGQDEPATLPEKYTSNVEYEVKWVKLAFTIEGTPEEIGGHLFFDFKITKDDNSSLSDGHLLLVAQFEGGLYVNEYTERLSFEEETVTIRMRVSTDHLMTVHAFLVNGTPSEGAFMNYGVYNYRVS